MEIARTILVVLIFILSVINLILTIRNSRRSASRNAALVQYVDKTMDAMHSEILKDVNDYTVGMKGSIEELTNKYGGMKTTLDDLSKGIVPDYEEAKRAADATNEFHRGIANILNYNEMDALRRMREAEQTGGEVE